MYEALDSYLRIDTWHTPHPLDSRRFFQALHKIVAEPGFSVEALRGYIQTKVEPSNPAFAQAIERRVEQAWAVREYLESTGQAQGPLTPP